VAADENVPAPPVNCGQLGPFATQAFVAADMRIARPQHFCRGDFYESGDSASI
jgi:hypothetical protein